MSMTSTPLRLLVLPLTLLLVIAACSDDTEDIQKDAAVAADQGTDSAVVPDLGALPDLPQKSKCDSEWRDAISPQKVASTGAVTTTDAGSGVKKTTIDATAGGMMNAHKNPYVYISFSTGKRVDIDDYAAKTSSAWDMAFRRAVIRSNSGDSGAGKGGVAISTDTFDKVTSVPAASSFAVDDFLTATCTIKKNRINDIYTAVGGPDGEWYNYSTGSMKLTPNKEVYIVRGGDGASIYKVVIDGYYSSTGAGASYTMRWAKLK